MEFHVRNADPKYIKEIDKKCEKISKRLGRRYSRSEYINSLIEMDCEKEYKKYKDEKFENVVNNLSVTLERQENKLQEYIDVTTELVGILLDKNE